MQGAAASAWAALGLKRVKPGVPRACVCPPLHVAARPNRVWSFCHSQDASRQRELGAMESFGRCSKSKQCRLSSWPLGACDTACTAYPQGPRLLHSDCTQSDSGTVPSQRCVHWLSLRLMCRPRIGLPFPRITVTAQHSEGLHRPAVAARPLGSAGKRAPATWQFRGSKAPGNAKRTGSACYACISGLNHLKCAIICTRMSRSDCTVP